MFVKREMIEMCKTKSKKGFFASLDTGKAYDGVNRRVMYKLVKCGMSEKNKDYKKDRKHVWKYESEVQSGWCRNWLGLQ